MCSPPPARAGRAPTRLRAVWRCRPLMECLPSRQLPLPGTPTGGGVTSAAPAPPRKSILTHQLPPAPTAPGTVPRACSRHMCACSAAPTRRPGPQFPHGVQDPWNGGAGAAVPRTHPATWLRTCSTPAAFTPPHCRARKVLEPRTGGWGPGATLAGTRLSPPPAPDPGHQGRPRSAPSCPPAVPHTAEPPEEEQGPWGGWSQGSETRRPPSAGRGAEVVPDAPRAGAAWEHIQPHVRDPRALPPALG